jgi:hypothetical protein
VNRGPRLTLDAAERPLLDRRVTRAILVGGRVPALRTQELVLRDGALLDASTLGERTQSG